MQTRYLGGSRLSFEPKLFLKCRVPLRNKSTISVNVQFRYAWKPLFQVRLGNWILCPHEITKYKTIERKTTNLFTQKYHKNCAGKVAICCDVSPKRLPYRLSQSPERAKFIMKKNYAHCRPILWKKMDCQIHLTPLLMNSKNDTTSCINIGVI